MTTTKINIGIALSRNFNNVKLEMLDEPVEYESEGEFKANVKKRYTLLRGLIEDEFRQIK